MEDFLKRVNHDSFTENTIKGVTFFTIDKISDLGIVHGFTSRLGGVSPGVYKSLNLSMTREDNSNNKFLNYAKVCEALGLNYDSLALVNYEHGNNVYILKSGDKGAGVSIPYNFERCDSLLTDNPELTAVTLHADCAPVFIADAKNKTAGVAHAGWKGTVSGLIPNVIKKMKDEFNSKPEDLIVGIGPHIMNCCFEIKEDIAEKFRNIDKNSVREQNHSMYGDLQYLLLKQLFEEKISPENVFCADLCTFCREDLFYSHRRDKGQTGAMGAFINVGK